MSKSKTSAVEFVKQVRQEVGRVTWPARRETTVTTTMVFILVGVAAVFFFLVDRVLAFGVKTFLGIGW
jgi:preprotein translocase subunit SecE